MTTNMMATLAKLKPEEGIWADRAPIPEPGPSDVLIQIKRTAICGTDIHIYNWDDWAARTVPVPMVVGHEFGDEIVEIGRDVTRPLTIGQRVSGEGHIIDMNSAAARSGRFHLDPSTQGVGVDRQGAFAEYLCIPAFNVVPLPDCVSLDIAALLDPFGNAVHTAQQFDLMGQNVLVTGAGPIGIMAAAVACRAGARAVILTDINAYRLALASNLANVRAVNVAEEDLRDVMHQEGIADGFDVAMEMSGAAPALLQAIDTLAMGGNLALLGIPDGTMEFDWNTVIMKAITVRGVYGREMFSTWQRMLGLLEGGMDLQPIITHRLPREEFQSGFDAMRSGRSGKVVLSW
ncbi:MAG: L-threonine 3-dehydrogenase [Novosphingobium sp.]